MQRIRYLGTLSTGHRLQDHRGRCACKEAGLLEVLSARIKDPGIGIQAFGLVFNQS